MIRSILKTGFLITVSAIVFMSCEKDDENTENVVPSVIEIDNFSLKLEADVWRDFMPVANTAMISKNKLIDQNQNDISTRFVLTKQYVMNGDEVWEAEYDSDTYDTEDYIEVRISREGPFWEAGLDVYVICQFTDNETDISYRIRTQNNTIEGVY